MANCLQQRTTRKRTVVTGTANASAVMTQINIVYWVALDADLAAGHGRERLIPDFFESVYTSCSHLIRTHAGSED